MHLGRLLLHLPEIFQGGSAVQAVYRALALGLLQYLDFLIRGGIADGQPQHEAVKLGLRQRLGARRTQGVLGGNDCIRLGELSGNPVHCHLPLLHGFQQGALGFGTGAVDFVCQKQVCHHRPGPVFQLPGGAVQNRIAHHVCGHHLRGKLHPGVGKAHGLGKSEGQGGLAHAGIVL